MKKKWIEYLLETIVIVVSILGAFALEHWNEERIERNEELKYLASLKLDMQEDLSRLSFMKEFRTAKISSAKALLKYYEQKTSEDQFEFFGHLNSVFVWREYNPNKNTIQELLNSGNLSMITNDSIRDQVLVLNQHLEELVALREHSRREFDHYLYDRLGLYIDLNEYSNLKPFANILSLNFDTLSIKRNSTKLNRDAANFLSDVTVRNGLFLAGANNMAMVYYYDEMIAHIEKLIATIDAEIERG